ncbi:hypothetical protein LXA43DRAFT_1184031 [Ganoderma leucocontextum]|nr:hypothetical protein LXA43DRAFT_1184031 [Ganoderma leucocontextum]
MVASKSRKAKKYGEKDSRLNEFRQKDQPPAALRRAVGNDEEAMAFCPSYGQPNLGDQAEPLPPESKDDYAKGPSKRTVKRKPCSTGNRTFPPDLPGPIMTVFSVTPPPPIIHPLTTQDPRDTLSTAGAIRLAPLYSPSVHEPRPHLPTARDTALALSHGPYAVDNNMYTTNPVTTPSLESYRGSPGTWAESPAPSMTPPSSYTAAQLSAAQGSARSEDHFHAVYHGFSVRRSSGGHESPLPALGEDQTNAASVVHYTAHESWNTMASMPDHVLYPLPSPPMVMNSPDLRMHDSTGTTSTDQAGYQRREPAGRVNYQHAQGPYPSHSDGSIAGHTRLSQSFATAQLSAVAGYARDVVAPPLAAAASHQVQQHDVSVIHAHTPHNNGHHVSTRSSPSYAHAGHVDSTPMAYTISAPLVNLFNQLSLGAPTTTNVQQQVQSTRASISAYSELAHALVDHHAMATQAGTAQGGIDAPLSSSQVEASTTGSPLTSGPRSLAWQPSS